MLFTTVPVKGIWTVYQLNKHTTMIGRDNSCDIIEPLPYVSLKHAKITYTTRPIISLIVIAALERSLMENR